MPTLCLDLCFLICGPKRGRLPHSARTWPLQGCSPLFSLDWSSAQCWSSSTSRLRGRGGGDPAEQCSTLPSRCAEHFSCSTLPSLEQRGGSACCRGANWALDLHKAVCGQRFRPSGISGARARVRGGSILGRPGSRQGAGFRPSVTSMAGDNTFRAGARVALLSHFLR
jgi:hypothetical protein